MDIIEATGADLRKFIGNIDRYETDANEMIVAMRQAAARGDIVEVTPQEAQRLGNQGYTVVPGGNGHVATVRPGDYNPSNPTVSNVGTHNRLWDVNTAFGRQGIKYYYNPRQTFNYNPSILNKCWGY